MSWTTSDAIAEQVRKRWERGDILAARVTGERLFPLELKLKRPTPREVADRFGDVLVWARGLANASRDVRGFGFDLRRETLANRVQGTNDLPVAAVIPSEVDALRLIRQEAAARRFADLVDASTRHPALLGWLARRPLAALEHAERWSEVLAVLDWFCANPRPGIYVRQLDIPGVDTKFVEAHRSLIAELLDLVLPDTAIDRTAVGTKAFERRYGLRSEPPLVRFRYLDRALYLHGLSDLSLLPDEFAALAPPRRVFITENRTNGLVFPDCAGAIVVFGLGYGLDRLARTSWLRGVDVHYWGDIDTHGFGILERLRAALPRARSFLMDRVTLEAHRHLWGTEPEEKRYAGTLGHLTADERSLYEDLRLDRFGERVRLEQERIGYGWVVSAIAMSGR